MLEFREQDSYINSDYDSDSSAESSSAPRRRESPPLTNSIIPHAASLVKAAAEAPRRSGAGPPKLRYVLSRLEEDPKGGYDDPRIPATFEAVRRRGVDLVFGFPTRPPPRRRRKELVPTRRILLDLSVVVALCCDSTHQPLPTSEMALESRFRPLCINSKGEGELAPHTNVSKDIRDQLQRESQHPLILEMQERLSGEDGPLEFCVTKEVHDRLPAIVEVIGGRQEKARAKALFRGEGFWTGSRWEGKAGVLRDLKVEVLDDDNPTTRDNLSEPQRSLIATCESTLDIVDPASTRCSDSPQSVVPEGKRSKRSTPIFPSSRLPSAHTLRTLVAGLTRGMTVLTNNRGAINKVFSANGAKTVLDDKRGKTRTGTNGMDLRQCLRPKDEDDGRAVVWVVNPSSLAEWRREEVEEQNRALREQHPSLSLLSGDR